MPILVGHHKILERARCVAIDRFGQHHGERRHARAVTAGVGRLIVYRGIDELDEGLEQFFQLSDKVTVGQCDGRLRGERFQQLPVVCRERDDRAAFPILRVDELQHADDFIFVVAHRHGQKRLGTITGLGVEFFGAGKIVALRRISIGNIHRLAAERRMAHHHGMIGIARLIVKLDRIEADRHAAGAAHRSLKRIVAQNLKAQYSLFRLMQIQRAGIGMGDALCRYQNGFQQTVEIALLRQRDADLIELFEAMQGVVGRMHGIVSGQSVGWVERSDTHRFTLTD